VDPGRTEPPLQSIPKIISGLDDIVPGSQRSIYRVYREIFDTIVQVSKPEVAEMMKLYENCQRMVCIAYANEMADACVSIGIDPFEVCSAASTKPFGYMPYTPGVGVGGHCIPVNPFYLLSNCNFPLLEAATQATWSRPGAIAERALASLQKCSPKYGRGRILVAGMGFKVGQSCLSNSPGLDLAQNLVLSHRSDVVWADPLVSQESIPNIPRLAESDWKKDVLQTFDMVIVVLRQIGLDFDVLDKLDGVRVERWCN
jgi:nucleotide sugar dehydrogenase